MTVVRLEERRGTWCETEGTCDVCRGSLQLEVTADGTLEIPSETEAGAACSLLHLGVSASPPCLHSVVSGLRT